MEMLGRNTKAMHNHLEQRRGDSEYIRKGEEAVSCYVRDTMPATPFNTRLLTYNPPGPDEAHDRDNDGVHVSRVALQGHAIVAYIVTGVLRQEARCTGRTEDRMSGVRYDKTTS